MIKNFHLGTKKNIFTNILEKKLCELSLATSYKDLHLKFLLEAKNMDNLSGNGPENNIDNDIFQLKLKKYIQRNILTFKVTAIEIVL